MGGGFTLWKVGGRYLWTHHVQFLDSLTEGASCGCVAVSQDVGEKRSHAPTAFSEACKGVAGADAGKEGYFCF